MPLNNAAMVVGANALATVLAYGQLHSGAAGSGGTSNVTTAARQPVVWSAPTGAGTLMLASAIVFTGGGSGNPVFSVTLWSGIALPAPTMGTTSTSTTGGTLAAATYYYKLTATNAVGETIASTEVSKTTTGTTSTVTIPWTAVTGATGYKLYRATSTGAEVFLTSIAGGSTATYTDTGAITPGVATPPSSSTTGGVFYGEFPLTGDAVFTGGGGFTVTAIDLVGSAS